MACAHGRGGFGTNPVHNAQMCAGWGRWLAAGAQLARQRNLAYALVAVEAEPQHFEWLKLVLQDNGITSEEQSLHPLAIAPQVGNVWFLMNDRPAEQYGQRVLTAREVKSFATDKNHRLEKLNARTLSSFIEPFDSIDLVSIDIGNLESDVVEEALTGLLRKARLLQVSTATTQTHRRLNSILGAAGWLPAFCFPPNSDSETPYGRVHFASGLQVWVDRSAAAVLDLIHGHTVYPVASVPPPRRPADPEAPKFLILMRRALDALTGTVSPRSLD